jgi:hypothetical protein
VNVGGYTVGKQSEGEEADKREEWGETEGIDEKRR